MRDCGYTFGRFAPALGDLALEHKNQDSVFFVNFSIVLAALGAIFTVCVVAASLTSPTRETDPAALAQVEARIKPVGEVVTDPAALLKKAAAKPQRAAYSGEQVVANVCGACHQGGLLGAPKEGDKAAWSARFKAESGEAGLAQSAIKGKNAMPARGGDADLSDDEVKAAVEHLLKLAGL